MASNKEKFEVTVKLTLLPFPVSLHMWEEEYLALLGSHQYKGFEVSAVLMQQIERMQVWRYDTGAIIVNPTWTEQSKELPDDYEV